MKKIIVVAFLFFTTNAFGCLNIFAVDSTGRTHYLEHHFFFSIEFKQQAIIKKLKSLEKAFIKNDYDFKNISDYGAYLLMSGHNTEGLTLFRALSKKYPDVYEIRANTAVAYELNGNIDSAYFWQVAAIKLKPNAHNNSEWIHLKILEAKKQMLTDPDWCLKNNVTGITDSISLYYKYSLHEDGQGMWILKQFIDQLEERLPFTYSEDKPMGKLIFELGNAYQAASIYRAYYCYAIAKYLYPQLASFADEKMRQIKIKYPKEVINKPKVSNKSGVTREMYPPDDKDVRQFLNEIMNRPSIKGYKFKSISFEELINKI